MTDWISDLLVSKMYAATTWVAAVSLAANFLSIGIDAEANVPLPAAVVNLISNEQDDGFLNQTRGFYAEPRFPTTLPKNRIPEPTTVVLTEFEPATLTAQPGDQIDLSLPTGDWHLFAAEENVRHQRPRLV